MAHVPNPPLWVKAVLDHLITLNMTPVIVGGPIRDLFLDHSPPPYDWDIEIFDCPDIHTLENALTTFGPLSHHGKAFGILQLRNDKETLDIALPRRELKTEKGHNGFRTTPTPDATFAQAACRRDFTLNAMGWDWKTQTLLDPFNGLKDLQNKILRHIGPAFSEDPLRVLRAVQFSARFHLTLDPETQKVCQAMWPSLFELPKERIEAELKKWLLKSPKPSIGLETLKQTHALHLFPELAALLEIPQDPTFHPEGDVWIHTGLVLDAMVSYKTGDDESDFTLMLAALCHDMGKPDTTVWAEKRNEWRWRSPRHDAVGVYKVRRFLSRFTQNKHRIDTVLSLVKTHMRPGQLYHQPPSISRVKSAILKLSNEVNLSYLWRLVSADGEGRTERYANDPVGPWLREKSMEWNIQNGPPQPIIQGRHLIELNLSPGPQFKKILDVAFGWQLQEKFSTLDQGLALLAHYLRSNKIK